MPTTSSDNDYITNRIDLGNWLELYKNQNPELKTLTNNDIPKILRLAGYINKNNRILIKRDIWLRCVKNYFEFLENKNYEKKLLISITKLKQSLIQAITTSLVMAEKPTVQNAAAIAKACNDAVAGKKVKSIFQQLTHFPISEAFVQKYNDVILDRLNAADEVRAIFNPQPINSFSANTPDVGTSTKDFENRAILHARIDPSKNAAAAPTPAADATGGVEQPLGPAAVGQKVPG